MGKNGQGIDYAAYLEIKDEMVKASKKEFENLIPALKDLFSGKYNNRQKEIIGEAVCQILSRAIHDKLPAVVNYILRILKNYSVNNSKVASIVHEILSSEENMLLKLAISNEDVKTLKSILETINELQACEAVDINEADDEAGINQYRKNSIDDDFEIVPRTHAFEADRETADIEDDFEIVIEDDIEHLVTQDEVIKIAETFEIISSKRVEMIILQDNAFILRSAISLGKPKILEELLEYISNDVLLHELKKDDYKLLKDVILYDCFSLLQTADKLLPQEDKNKIICKGSSVLERVINSGNPNMLTLLIGWVKEETRQDAVDFVRVQFDKANVHNRERLTPAYYIKSALSKQPHMLNSIVSMHYGLLEKGFSMVQLNDAYFKLFKCYGMIIEGVVKEEGTTKVSFKWGGKTFDKSTLAKIYSEYQTFTERLYKEAYDNSVVAYNVAI
jgi:hypothetical protein